LDGWPVCPARLAVECRSTDRPRPHRQNGGLRKTKKAMLAIEEPDMAIFGEPITIKRYANRRLYNPGAGRYVTLGNLADMIEDDEEFAVNDAKTGEDVTRWVLKQIILERAGHG
jgi:hypothetical protein